MNIVFGIRGEKYLQDMIVNQLNHQWFNLPKTKDGKTVNVPITHCLQPIQLYSYAVPKEYSNQVINSLKFNNERYTYGSLKAKMTTAMIRKTMGLKPMPKAQPCNVDKLIPLPENVMQHMHIFPIGIKEDVSQTDPEGYYREFI